MIEIKPIQNQRIKNYYYEELDYFFNGFIPGELSLPAVAVRCNNQDIE